MHILTTSLPSQCTIIVLAATLFSSSAAQAIALRPLPLTYSAQACVDTVRTNGALIVAGGNRFSACLAHWYSGHPSCRPLRLALEQAAREENRIVEQCIASGEYSGPAAVLSTQLKEASGALGSMLASKVMLDDPYAVLLNDDVSYTKSIVDTVAKNLSRTKSDATPSDVMLAYAAQSMSGANDNPLSKWVSARALTFIRATYSGAMESFDQGVSSFGGSVNRIQPVVPVGNIEVAPQPTCGPGCRRAQ